MEDAGHPGGPLDGKPGAEEAGGQVDGQQVQIPEMRS